MAPEVKTTVVCAVMAINFFTSLSIVLLNKYIFKKFDIGPVGLSQDFKMFTCKKTTHKI